MRILFVVHQFLPEFASGTEVVTLNLAKSAQRDGHEVAVLTAALGTSSWKTQPCAGLRCAMVEGVPVFGVPAETMSPLSTLAFEENEAFSAAVEHWLESCPRYDVVHFVHTMRVFGAIDIFRRRGIPYILTLTDFFLPCYRINLMRRSRAFCSTGPDGGSACDRHCRTDEITGDMLRKRFARLGEALRGAATVVACSQFVARAFRRSYPQLEIRVVPHGIDLLRFRPRTREPNPQQLVFGYIGTIVEAKGIDTLIAGFKAAAPENARLQVIGPAHDRAYAESVERGLDSSCNVSLLPPASASQVPDLLEAFDVLCLPSLVPETFSLSLHEGFAAGLPSLVSDLGHPADVVEEYRCGQVLPAGDVQAWSQAIAAICADPSRLRDLSSRVPLPWRLEEEAFVYSQLYRACTADAQT